jgi:hypothetical protein
MQSIQLDHTDRRILELLQTELGVASRVYVKKV